MMHSRPMRAGARRCTLSQIAVSAPISTPVSTMALGWIRAAGMGPSVRGGGMRRVGTRCGQRHQIELAPALDRHPLGGAGFERAIRRVHRGDRLQAFGGADPRLTAVV